MNRKQGKGKRMEKGRENKIEGYKWEREREGKR